MDGRKLYAEAKLIDDRLMGPTWRYFARGARGAVEFWVRDRGADFDREYGERYYGGIEVHSNESTDGVSPPDHLRCYANGERPCWHDGSSLAATEQWIPMWEARCDEFMILDQLKGEYLLRFHGKETD